MLDLVRRFLCVCLLAVVVSAPLSGCSQAVKTTNAAGLDDSIAMLASGGVAVMDTFSSTLPVVATAGTPSAMRFTRWQVQNLVAEANGHAGYIGSELDALAPPPKGAPPLSILIGAWLTRNDGALANYAHGFMGDPDYKQSASLVFPTIVVLTFIADIARFPAASQVRLPSFDLERFIASPADAQDSACTSIANWVAGVVSSVTHAVQVNGQSWLASLWNTAVSLVGTAISITINGLTDSLVGFIARIAAICGTLMQVASMFKPWSVALAANPSTITLADAAQSGAFDATLNAKDIAWPSELVGCVTAISKNTVDLTKASYKDAPVTWTQPVSIPGLATKQAEDDTLADDKTAHYTYSTETVEVPAANDCPRLVNAGKIGITVTVERSDITKTLTSLEALIFGQLNSQIQSYLQKYIAPAVDAVTSTANKFAAPHESAIVTLKQNVADPLCVHTPPPNAAQTPSPSPSPTRSSAGYAQLPSGPCDPILNSFDTASVLSGAVDVFAGAEVRQKIDDISHLVTGLNPGGTITSDGYDASRSSTCFLGVPTTSGDPAMVANFVVTPRGPVTYDYPDIHAGPIDPTSCRSLIGYALLDRFHADCKDDMIGQMKLEAPGVEYLLVAWAFRTSTDASAIPVQPGQFAAVIKNLLERYQ